MSDIERANTDIIFVYSVVITGFLCLFGFVGNILSLIALIRDKCKNSNVCLLSALAVADWFMLAFIFNGVVIIQFCKYFRYMSYINFLRSSDTALPVLWVIGCVVQTASIWYVVAVTWDRFLAVYAPFESIKGRSNSMRRARRIIVAVLVFSVLFNLPRAFHYFPMEGGLIEVTEINQTTNHSNSNNNASSSEPEVVVLSANVERYNGDVKDLEYTVVDIGDEAIKNWTLNLKLATTPAVENKSIKQVRHNKWYFYLYYISMSWLVLYIVPFLSLLILNILLLRQIRKASQLRTTMLGSRHRQTESISVTANIVAVVTTFIICQAPDFIHTLVSYPSMGINRSSQEYIKAAAYIFLAFNSSVNFIIYCLFYKRFRKTVFRMCCKYVNKYSTQLVMMHKIQDSRRTSFTSDTFLPKASVTVNYG